MLQKLKRLITRRSRKQNFVLEMQRLADQARRDAADQISAMFNRRKEDLPVDSERRIKHA